MIYCQLRPEAELPLGAPLRLGNVARLIAPEGAENIPLPCPDREGVWRLDALLCARALRDACPGEEVSLLGAESCYIRRVKRHQPDPLRWLRAATACLILLLGSALGLSWFHSDVDMPAAQVMVYRLLTGQEPEDSRWITVPYCVGVALGVAVFYALPSARAVTPMEVKLSAYRADMEKAQGKEIHDGP